MSERTFSVRLSARVDAYVSAIKKAERETVGFTRETSRNMARVGKQMQNVGADMTRYVSVPLALVGAGAVMAAVKWDSAWAGVAKTVRGSAAELQGLEDDLRGLTEILPASHTEIAAVAAAAGQLGIAVADITEFTRVMVNLGVTTNLTSNEAATALARIANIMGTTSGNYENLGSVIVELGNNSATTEAEIVELSTRIAAAGKVAGLSEADVFAFASTVTSVGVQAEAGGTALSKVFLKIRDAVIDGSDKLDVFARVAGMSATEFSRAFRDDAAGTIALWIEGVGNMERAGKSTTAVFEELGIADVRLMASIRGTAAAEGLLNEQLIMARDAWRQNNALQIEADRRYATTAARFGLLRNAAVELGIQLGDMLLPALEALMGGARSFIQELQLMPPAMQGIVMGFGALVAAAGPVIFVLGSLIRNYKEMRTAMAAMSFASLGPVMLGVTAAIGAAAAAWTLYSSQSRRAAEIERELEAQRRATEESIQSIAEAIKAAGDPTIALTTTLADLALDSDVLRAALQGAGLSIESLVTNMVNGTATTDLWEQKLIAAAIAAGYSTEQARAMGYAFTQWATEAGIAVGRTAQLEQVSTDAAMAALAHGEGLDEETDATDAATRAAEIYEAQVAATNRRLEEARQVLREHVEALREQMNAHRAAADATFALHDAQSNVSDSIATLNEVMEDEESTLQDVGDALRDTVRSMADVADAQIRIAEETATANGETLTASQRIRMFNESMIASAATAEGPLRDALIGYVAQVNGIPAEHATMILAELAEGDVEGAEAMLNFLSRTRATAVEVDADTAKAEDDINWVARGRTTKITLQIGGAIPKFYDEGGYAKKGDIVAEKGPEYVNGRLVTQPMMLGRDAFVLGREDTARLLSSRRYMPAGTAMSSTPTPAPVSGPVTGVHVEHYHDRSGHALENVFSAANASLILMGAAA